MLSNSESTTMGTHFSRRQNPAGHRDIGRQAVTGNEKRSRKGRWV